MTFQISGKLNHLDHAAATAAVPAGANSSEDQQLAWVAMGLTTIPKLSLYKHADRLQRLSLHGNRIGKVENLGSLRALTALVLSGNRLRSLGGGLAGLSTLVKLDLSKNLLAGVDGLEGLTALAHLVHLTLPCSRLAHSTAALSCYAAAALLHMSPLYMRTRFTCDMWMCRHVIDMSMSPCNCCPAHCASPTAGGENAASSGSSARHLALGMQRLANNQISSLKGLGDLHGEKCSLSDIDLRGNQLGALSSLAPLAGCCSLQSLLLSASGTSQTGLQLASR